MKNYAFVFIVMLLLGCTNEGQSEKPIIAVSSYPVHDFVSNVIDEDEFELWLMLPPGLNAHAYEPTPQDIVKLSQSEVFVYTSGHFEIWAEKTVSGLGAKKPLVVDASRTVPLVKPDDETLGPIDPHTWLSPKNAKLQVEHIAGALTEKYPDKAERVERKKTSYMQKLDELDRKYEDTIRTCRHREMFVSHAAFGYLANQYNLTQVPIIKNFDPQGEVSLADLAGVIEAAKRVNASHIFFEDFISPKLSEAVAREINGTTAVFSPMEAYAAEQLENDSYIEVMERNLQTLREALDCG